MRTFFLTAGLYALSGGIVLMGLQTLAEHPNQHSGTQRAVLVRAYQ